MWSCSLTGKSNLTLEEALEAEAAARQKLEKFPIVLEKPTLLLAHHSQKNLDWMATTLTNQYKSHCATGEIVTVLLGEEKKYGNVFCSCFKLCSSFNKSFCIVFLVGRIQFYTKLIPLKTTLAVMFYDGSFYLKNLIKKLKN